MQEGQEKPGSRRDSGRGPGCCFSAPLGQPQEWYRRTRHWEAGQRLDDGDGRPFATEFAFLRCLAPALMKNATWALFCDCDFLFLDDVARLWRLRDSRYAVQCVPHRHEPRPSLKLDGTTRLGPGEPRIAARVK